MSLAISDRDLLEAWAKTRGRDAVEHVDALLARAASSDGDRAISSWPVARRNAAVVGLRTSWLGSGLEATVPCPGCGEDLEFPFDLDALPDPLDRGPGPELHLETEHGPVRFRLPTGADVDAVASLDDSPAAQRALAERCVIAAPEALGRLTDEVVAAISKRMSDLDPAGALALELRCPECGCRWEQELDLSEFIACEAEREVRRIAAEVHTLASAYGWSEEEVLILPPERRRLYLEMVAQ